MDLHPKPIIWAGSSLDDLRQFPETVRQRAGHQLRRVQLGLMPDDWKPMPSVGPGVCEIRLHGRPAYRVIYRARFGEGVYVLHAFEKRSRKTRGLDVDLARTRLAAVLRRWSRQGGAG